MRIIYVAGPMRGIKYFNFPAFDAAKEHLERSGDWDKIISPADLDREVGFDETAFPDDYDWIDLKKADFNLVDAIDRDVAALKVCSAIYMLDGWEKSKGAKAEKALAEWMGCKVLYQTPLKDGCTITNEQGGKQSFIAARFDCVPPVVLRLLAQCLGFGARKYGKENWKQIPMEDNLAHAMNHINEWNLGDRSEPHLVNAMARLSFATFQAVESGQQENVYIHPEMNNV
jgi:hypothetical protein